MVQSQSSLSHQVLPERRPAEHLEETEDNGGLLSSGESTSFSMAQRFGPDIQAVSPPDPTFNGPRTQIAVPDPSRGAWATRALLAVLILVSLVPSAIVGVTLWLGMVRSPWPGSLVAPYESGPLKSPQAWIASAPPPATVQPKKDVRGLSVALTALETVQAEAGKEVPFSIAINSADPLPPRATINIEGMPEGATFSNGRSYGDTAWTLRPDEIGADLRLRLPNVGQTDLRIDLLAADGELIASAFTHVNITTDPNAAFLLRPEERDRISDLMIHGHKMVEVGYLAGARAYFRRAAEAGSGDAAVALGDTYDPAFIESIGAHGIKADVAQARTWYERARELGSEAAKAKLERLKHADDAQLTSVHESVPSNVGTGGSAAGHANVEPTPNLGEAASSPGNQR
jgi:hypothetical protein